MNDNWLGRLNGHRTARLLATATAAFAAYFCMYAFRKPFTAATYESLTVWGMDLKSVLVLSQLLGYTVSKFIGIKVVSEMKSEYRAVAILGLIALAELALIGFAVLPIQLKILMIFLNGLPLGMVFGLILAYLEGRKQTEALTAALCASFIVSSGVVKSVGSWLMQSWNVSDYSMPALTGLIFTPLLILAVYMLQATPPPDTSDLQLRSERSAMTGSDRRNLVREYLPGLILLIAVYIALTIVRTIRDDFAVELWSAMGVVDTPSIFTTSEMLVGIFVTAFSAIVIWVKDNLLALRLTICSMCISFGLVISSTLLRENGFLSPYLFMVACGIGLYVPYVAFHTTIFERLIAAARMPGNLGFLMYLADSIGYLGYATIIVARTQMLQTVQLLPLFKWTLLAGSTLSIVCLVATLLYLQRKLVSIPARDATHIDAPHPETAHS